VRIDAVFTLSLSKGIMQTKRTTVLTLDIILIISFAPCYARADGHSAYNPAQSDIYRLKPSVDARFPPQAGMTNN
jgi:hypothetical protein